MSNSESSILGIKQIRRSVSSDLQNKMHLHTYLPSGQSS